MHAREADCTIGGLAGKLPASRTEPEGGGPIDTTDTTHTCPHGFPTPTACADCLFEGNFTLPDSGRQHSEKTAPPSHPFAAKYDGVCVVCLEQIRQGEKVVYVGTKRLAHYRHLAGGARP